MCDSAYIKDALLAFKWLRELWLTSSSYICWKNVMKPQNKLTIIPRTGVVYMCLGELLAFRETSNNEISG